MSGDARKDIGQPRLRIDFVKPGRLDQLVEYGRAQSAAVEPQNSHALCTSGTHRSARSAALFVMQIRPSSRKRVRSVPMASISIQSVTSFAHQVNLNSSSF